MLPPCAYGPAVSGAPTSARARAIARFFGVAVVVGVALAACTAYAEQPATQWVPDALVGLAAVTLGGVSWRRSWATSVLALLVAASWWAGTIWSPALYWHRGAFAALVLCAPGIRPRSRVAVTAVLVTAGASLIAPVWSSDAATVGLATIVLIGGVAEARVRGRRRWLIAPAVLAATVAGAAAADAATLDAVGVLVGYDVALLVVLVAEGIVTRTPGWSTLTDLAVDLGRAPVRDVGSLTALIRAEPGLEDDLSAAIDAARRWESSNARTRAELQLAVVEVEQSRRRLVTAAAEARARLASEIGSSAVLALRSLADRADVAGMTPGVQRALASLEAAVAGLRPPGLDSGVAAAVRDLPLVAELSVQLDLSEARCPTVVEDTLFAVAAESLGNVAKYAGPCRVTVSYEVVGGSAELSVVDDGVGGARPGSGSGLLGLADRVEALGGRFIVRSPGGTGTTVTAGVPTSEGATTPQEAQGWPAALRHRPSAGHKPAAADTAEWRECGQGARSPR